MVFPPSLPTSPSSTSLMHAGGSLMSQDGMIASPLHRRGLLDLPDELLGHVCARLETHCNISNVMQTCRHLYKIAEPFYFADVSYRNPRSVMSLIAALRKKPERPLWVRELHLGFYHYRASPFADDFDLLSVVPLFENLETVELRYRSYTTVVLDTHGTDSLDGSDPERSPGSARQIDKGRWAIDTLKRLFAFNSVMAAGRFDVLHGTSTNAPVMSESSALTPPLPPVPFRRLRRCTIHGDRTGGVPEIWSIFLASRTIRSISLVACDIKDVEIGDTGIQRTTPLQELILRYCSITAPSLTQIVSVPKALEKIVILAPTITPRKDRPQVLLDAIKLQKQSLRFIEIDHRFDNDPTDKLDFDDFEHFERLHTITIDQETRSTLPHRDAASADQMLG
jgi:hypothetical protein